MFLISYNSKYFGDVCMVRGGIDKSLERIIKGFGNKNNNDFLKGSLRGSGHKAENKKPFHSPEDEHDLKKMEFKKINSTLDASHLKSVGANHKMIAGFLNLKYGHEYIPWALNKAGFSERKIIQAINQRKLGLSDTEKITSLDKLITDWQLPLPKIEKEINKLKRDAFFGSGLFYTR